ncbi:MAG: hypothetical protein QM817_36385 [Archangium sp.]
MTFALIILLAAAEPDSSGRGASREPLTVHFTFGLSGGAGVGERFRWILGLGELWAIADVALGKLFHVRGLLGARVGTMGAEYPLYGFQAGLQARVRPLPWLSLGAGLELGFLSVASPGSLILFAGPTVTPIAVHFGARHEHELSASWLLPLDLYSLVNLQFSPQGQYVFLRYAYFF